MGQTSDNLGIIRDINDVDTTACLYYALKHSGRADEIFDGHSLMWFLDEFQKRKNYICCRNNQVIGFGWVNDFFGGNRRAEVSFGFLPTASPFDSVKCGISMLRDVFESDIRLLWIYGTTPSRNKAALKYAKLIGMKEVGRTPYFLDYKGEPDDAVITFAERELYLNGKNPGISII